MKGIKAKRKEKRGEKKEEKGKISSCAGFVAFEEWCSNLAATISER